MPNIKSAKKRVKVIATKTEQNKMIKSNLKTTVKKAYAAILLIRLRVPISGWAAFDDVGDIAVGVPVQVDNGEHVVQQHSRRAYKGFTPQILLLPRSFSHKHDVRVRIPHPEHHMVTGGCQPAAAAVFTGSPQCLPISHDYQLLLRFALRRRRFARP